MLDALSEELKRIEPDFPIKISPVSNTPSEMRVSGLPELLYGFWYHDLSILFLVLAIL
jgi:hypothetical protein